MSSVPKSRTLRRAAGLFRPYRGQVAVTVLAILVGAGLGIISPFLIRAIFDDALFVDGGPDLELLVILVVAMIAVAVASGAIGVGQVYLTNVVGNNVMHDLRDRLYTHLQSMPLAFFTATRTGDLQSRLANDIGGIQTVLTSTAPAALGNVVAVLAAFIAMVILSWQLTIISLILVPLFIVLTYRVGRVRRAVTAKTQSSIAEMNAITQETLSPSGIMLAKVFDRQPQEIARYREASGRLADLQVRQQMTGQSFFAVVQAFFGITPALIYLVAGLALESGSGPQLTAGTLVAFTAVQTRVFWPIVQLLRESVEMQGSLAQFDRVFEYLDLKPDIVDSPTANDIDKEEIEGAVTFRDVSFAYPTGPRASAEPSSDGSETDGGPPTRRLALNAVSFEIEPGQLAALVGPSGAGKTTVSYLIPRLYEPTSGVVEMDGVDVQQIRLRSLAECIGVVTQESYLFHASVRENLLYARHDASQEDIESATRAAFIHDRIMELDDGYDTVVGERGYRLSGGEKQRLAIARVLLKDPRVLILDEATSALDTRSERLVQRALEPLMAGRTTIAIAHRLSTIIAADAIFVLSNGELVERGTHEELLARGDLYAELYREQFQSGLIESRCANGVVLANGAVVKTGEPALAAN